MVAGIYKITNMNNGKCYYGSTDNLKRREKVHFTLLGRNAHENPHLQASYNIYGKEAFKFEIIEQIDGLRGQELEEKLSEKEQIFLDVFAGTESCYNISKCSFAPMRGRKHTEEAKIKMRQAKAGKNIGSDNPMFGKSRPDLILRNKNNSGENAAAYGRRGNKHPMFGKPNTWLKEYNLSRRGTKRKKKEAPQEFDNSLEPAKMESQ